MNNVEDEQPFEEWLRVKVRNLMATRSIVDRSIVGLNYPHDGR